MKNVDKIFNFHKIMAQIWKNSYKYLKITPSRNLNFSFYLWWGTAALNAPLLYGWLISSAWCMFKAACWSLDFEPSTLSSYTPFISSSPLPPSFSPVLSSQSITYFTPRRASGASVSSVRWHFSPLSHTLLVSFPLTSSGSHQIEKNTYCKAAWPSKSLE